jgi:hypothetical protein
MRPRHLVVPLVAFGLLFDVALVGVAGRPKDQPRAAATPAPRPRDAVPYPAAGGVAIVLDGRSTAQMRVPSTWGVSSQTAPNLVEFGTFDGCATASVLGVSFRGGDQDRMRRAVTILGQITGSTFNLGETQTWKRRLLTDVPRRRAVTFTAYDPANEQAVMAARLTGRRVVTALVVHVMPTRHANCTAVARRASATALLRTALSPRLAGGRFD